VSRFRFIAVEKATYPVVRLCRVLKVSKTELLHRQSWPTRRQARTAIFEYIEVFYSRQRRHATLGYLAPAELEHRYHRQAVAA
jgi:transposase InsO family protein